jgi:hypothetical protein
VAHPDDDERTVADALSVARARSATVEEATRVEAPPRMDQAGSATEVAGSSEVPIIRELRARDRESQREKEAERDRLGPPVPPSPPRGPVAPGPSAPTDPGGVMLNFHPSAPTLPNPVISDEEATRLAPRSEKKKPRPGPPLIGRPAARQALQRLRRFTSEISAVSIGSKSVQRRRVSRLLLAVLAAFGVVVLIQVYKAFSTNNAEMARPMGKKVEEPDFFDRLFKFF